MKSRLFYSILLLSCLDAAAFNHPQIEWQTVATKHFRINFYDKTEPAVYATWKIAEEAYAKLSELYGYEFTDKIDIALADYDDYSNGWASWTDRSIGIWLPDAQFDLRGNTTWLRNVLTHEITHIISMEKEKGMQLLVWSLLFDYASPSLDLTLTEPVAFQTFLPAWFAEGAAQMGAGRLSSDCWDSRRDMLLRCAALDKRLLSLEEMGHFTHDWVGNEMVYNQGYSFTMFIENRLGAVRCASVWKKSRERKLFGRSFNRLVEEELGVPAERLYATWRDSVMSAAKENLPANATATQPLFDKSTYNKMPRISPDGRLLGFLSNDGGESRRTDLVITDRSGARLIARVPYAQTCWRFHPNGKGVFYIKSRDPNNDGSFLNDIYAYDIEQRTESRLTSSARIYDFDVSPDGATMCCVRFSNGAFGMDLYSIAAGSFTHVFDGRMGEPFLGLTYHPSSGDSAVVCRVVEGTAGLYIADLKSRTLEPLAGTHAQEEGPYWADDGRIYFSADYDGIFNIYSLRSDATGLLRHTAVPGGAFTPCRTPEGGPGHFRVYGTRVPHRDMPE